MTVTEPCHLGVGHGHQQTTIIEFVEVHIAHAAIGRQCTHVGHELRVVLPLFQPRASLAHSNAPLKTRL